MPPAWWLGHLRRIGRALFQGARIKARELDQRREVMPDKLRPSLPRDAVALAPGAYRVDALSGECGRHGPIAPGVVDDLLMASHDPCMMHHASFGQDATCVTSSAKMTL